MSFRLFRRLTVSTLVAGTLVTGLALPTAAVAAPAPLTSAAIVIPSAAATARTTAAVEAAERARFAVAREAHLAQIAVIRTKIVKLARKQLGDRYSAGQSGPNAFDCSGLVRYVFKKVLHRELPHYSGAQYRISHRVSRKNARPGDLVFFLRGGAHHVGIYIGKGRMIDAAGYGEGVRVSPTSGSWWGRTFTGMGRIVPA